MTVTLGERYQISTCGSFCRVLSGDLSTMALADVLQWVDATRMRALIRVERAEGITAWLLASERMVIAGSPPMARGRLATDGSPEAPGPGLRAVTVEHLLDLFLWRDGRFELREAAARPDPAIEVELPIQFLVMEGLRLLDEQPRLDKTYPDDKARLAATDADASELDTIQSAIYQLAQTAPALGEARLVLGLSRSALLRRVDELRVRGLVDVEGIAHGPDVEGSLIDQAQILLRERQYAEAAHVFRSLLASNPNDARVRRLLSDAERLEVEAAYTLFSPTDIVTLTGEPSRHRLSGADQTILDALSRPRSVAVLVLVSPLRELETLKALERLLGKSVVTVEPAD
jgi:hypothetical protein